VAFPECIPGGALSRVTRGLAEPTFCTDNAAMIGYVAALRLATGESSSFTEDIDPNLRLVA
jgi:N6-L-threonylcarbamoyladenine synthase